MLFAGVVPALSGASGTLSGRLLGWSEHGSQQFAELLEEVRALEVRLAECEALGAAPSARITALSPSWLVDETILWLWASRLVMAAIVIISTCIVLPRDKQLQKAKLRDELARRTDSDHGDDREDSGAHSLQKSLGDWAASQERVWAEHYPHHSNVAENVEMPDDGAHSFEYQWTTGPPRLAAYWGARRFARWC